MKRVRGCTGTILFGLCAAALAVSSVHAQLNQPVSASVIPRDRLLEPDALNHELQSNPHGSLILQVGSKVLFDQAHIHGAEYAGPGSRPRGIAALRSRVANLPRGQAIVLYCGCCPWDRCPNIGSAWQLLQQMGFTNVKVLHIANNFGSDWVSRGYRAESTH
ncbi:MAG TPA: rhodanese-like domain-containing protein [Acidobacteriaceae bacterium]|nr:rhodanese-like domain-containing protein [Acidobacteriaceae bacterium]